MNRAAKCVYSKFRFNIAEREAHGCERRGSAACAARRFRLSSQFAKDGRQAKISIGMLMHHYGEHPFATRDRDVPFRRSTLILHCKGFAQQKNANSQSGGAFFLLWRRKRANPCGIKTFCARTDPET